MKIPGRFPRRVLNKLIENHPGWALAVVGDEIHATSLYPDDPGWVLQDRNGPLKVEPEPFLTGAANNWTSLPDFLLVRLAGETELTMLYSADDFRTFSTYEEYGEMTRT